MKKSLSVKKSPPKEECAKARGGRDYEFNKFMNLFRSSGHQVAEPHDGAGTQARESEPLKDAWRLLLAESSGGGSGSWEGLEGRIMVLAGGTG